jgi:hypothetical protein
MSGESTAGTFRRHTEAGATVRAAFRLNEQELTKLPKYLVLMQTFAPRRLPPHTRLSAQPRTKSRRRFEPSEPSSTTCPTLPVGLERS